MFLCRVFINFLQQKLSCLLVCFCFGALNNGAIPFREVYYFFIGFLFLGEVLMISKVEIIHVPLIHIFKSRMPITGTTELIHANTDQVCTAAASTVLMLWSSTLTSFLLSIYLMTN